MKKKIFLIILVFFITFDYFVKLNINKELSKFNTNIKVQSKYKGQKKIKINYYFSFYSSYYFYNNNT